MSQLLCCNYVNDIELTILCKLYYYLFITRKERVKDIEKLIKKAQGLRHYWVYYFFYLCSSPKDFQLYFDP